MKSYRIDIDGMDCERCASTVSAALRATPGAADVTIDLATCQARVVIDEQQGGVVELVNAVRTAGFPVRAFHDDSAVGPR